MSLDPKYTAYPYAGTPDVGFAHVTRSDGITVGFQNVPRDVFERWFETAVVRVGNVVIFAPALMELLPPNVTPPLVSVVHEFPVES